MNGSGDGVPLGSADVILESAIGFGIVVCQNDWSPPRPNFSFAGGCDPFLGVDPLLPVLDPLPVFATAPALGLYHHTANAPRRPKSFDVSDPTLLLGQTLPLLASAPYPRALSVFFPAIWIPEKIPRNRSGRALPNVPRTFPLFESQSNHSFIGEPHGGRQLWEPEMRLLGSTSIGLTIYL